MPDLLGIDPRRPGKKQAMARHGMHYEASNWARVPPAGPCFPRTCERLPWEGREKKHETPPVDNFIVVSFAAKVLVAFRDGRRFARF